LEIFNTHKIYLPYGQQPKKKQIGIYEVEYDNTNKKDEAWYINTNQSFAFAGGKVTGSYGTATARPHADVLFTSTR